MMQRKIGRDTLLCALVFERSSFLERLLLTLSRETGMLLFAPLASFTG